MTPNELICRIALTRIKGVGPVIARRLIEACGCAEAVFALRGSELQQRVLGISRRLQDALLDSDALKGAQAEATWIERHRIEPLLLGTDAYPSLLSECADAPVVLYYKGDAEALSSAHRLSIVGTRSMTAYGRATVSKLIADLADRVPDLLVVSGLAYGVDVEAHRAALANGIATLGVLAHGLDRIYPASHRQVAREMCARGGLITEYPSQTSPDRYNFVARNRIIAGLSSATLVIESSLKGGSLISANLAAAYDREVFAVPGRITDKYSAGTNRLIGRQEAIAVTSAEEIITSLGWVEGTDAHAVAQTLQFAEEKPLPSDDDQRVVLQAIREHQPIQLGELVGFTGLAVASLSAALFELEMDGYVLSLPGGLYTTA